MPLRVKELIVIKNFAPLKTVTHIHNFYEAGVPVFSLTAVT